MTTTMLDLKILGFWARCVRQSQNLSQEALAANANITVRTVQRFEAGEAVHIGSRRALALMVKEASDEHPEVFKRSFEKGIAVADENLSVRTSYPEICRLNREMENKLPK